MTTPTTFIPGEIGGVEPDDKILVNRSGQSYYVDPNELAEKARGDDLLLVNYLGQSYKCKYEDIDNAADTALLLINRGGRSYHVTMGELRGAISQNVTFDLRITSPNVGGEAIGPNMAWNPPRQANAVGSLLTCTITASSKDAYSFTPIGNQSAPESKLSQFNINGEWIAVAGESGSVTIIATSLYGEFQAWPVQGENAKGLANIGVNNLVPRPQFIQDYRGPYYYNGRYSGGGVPGGQNSGTPFPGDYGGQPGPQDGGYSQTRNRAENTGDFFGEIEITNVQWQLNPASIGYIPNSITTSTEAPTITCNGITKSVGDIPASGIIGDFLNWT